jgi:hypothetical protein
MIRNQMNNPEINPDAIDHILATEEPLIPSSGFLTTVMESMHEEARMLAPIPFPWKRAVPGMLLAAGVFGWGAFEFIRQAVPAIGALALTQAPLSAAAERPLEQIGWVALALALSLASWLLSRRLAGQSGLL